MFTPDHGLLLLCWILYCALHSALAVTSWKQWIEKQSGTSYRYYRIVYSLFATVSLIALLWFHFNFTPGPELLKGIFFEYAGLFMTITGGVLMAICIRKYFFNLSGINVFFKKENIETPTLERGGLHRFTRHPLYFGTLLFAWGFFFIWPYPHHLIANVVMTLYVMMAISWEEKKLVQEFGNAYREYAAQVPRLIPWKLKI